MNPDRMVIKEAQRTFTYLNLYGYLTDAVIVNRVFPDELAGGYFGEWHDAPARAPRGGARRLRAAAAAHRAGTSRRRWSGTRMLDRLGDELFGDSVEPAAVLHTELGARARPPRTAPPTLRIPVPFGERGDVGLKKVGPELIVSVGPRKRTIILPTALAARSPTGAKLADGALEVRFETATKATAGV